MEAGHGLSGSQANSKTIPGSNLLEIEGPEGGVSMARCTGETLRQDCGQRVDLLFLVSIVLRQSSRVERQAECGGAAQGV